MSGELDLFGTTVDSDGGGITPFIQEVEEATPAAAGVEDAGVPIGG